MATCGSAQGAQAQPQIDSILLAELRLPDGRRSGFRTQPPGSGYIQHPHKLGANVGGPELSQPLPADKRETDPQNIPDFLRAEHVCAVGGQF